MQPLKLKPGLVLILVGLVLGWGTLSSSVEAQAETLPDTHAAKVKHSIPSSAVEVGRIGAFPITNSMLVTWGVAAALIIFAQLATRNMSKVPGGAQNFWEWLVESLYSFLEGIIGSTLVKKTFWFFATIFIFILFSN